MIKSGSSTKGMLSRWRRDLALYRQVLPSLELKRQQLLAERLREKRALDDACSALAALHEEAGSRFPMLARAEISINEFAHIDRVESAERRILGTSVPVLAGIRWRSVAYGLLTKPHWVDGAIVILRRVARQRLEIAFAEERLRRLDRAIKKVIQRVNLFQKVLIPMAESEIKRIRIALADAERDAVVRSKIFKHRHPDAAQVRS